MSYRNNNSKEFTVLWVKAEQKQLHQTGFHSVNKICPKQIKINRTPRETFSSFEFQSNKGRVHQIIRPELQTYNKLVQPAWPWRPNWRKQQKQQTPAQFWFALHRKAVRIQAGPLYIALHRLHYSSQTQTKSESLQGTLLSNAATKSGQLHGHPDHLVDSVLHPICVASKWRARTIHL